MIEGYVPVYNDGEKDWPFWDECRTTEAAAWDARYQKSWKQVADLKADGWRVVKVREAIAAARCGELNGWFHRCILQKEHPGNHKFYPDRESEIALEVREVEG